MPTISKDIPLSEITLRRYEKPSSKDERELVRKLCLSLGLLQPGDSRDVIVDVFLVLLKESKKKNSLRGEELRQRVIEERKRHHLSSQGTAASNMRRQVRRLKDVFLVEKHDNRYRIAEYASLRELFESKIARIAINSASERILEYCDAVDKS